MEESKVDWSRGWRVGCREQDLLGRVEGTRVEVLKMAQLWQSLRDRALRDASGQGVLFIKRVPVSTLVIFKQA